MQQDIEKQIDLEYERYKDWDFSNAKPANQNPLIKKLQDNVKKAQQQQLLDNVLFFDNDVIEMIKQHNNPTDKKRANTVLRALFETA